MAESPVYKPRLKKCKVHPRVSSATTAYNELPKTPIPRLLRALTNSPTEQKAVVTDKTTPRYGGQFMIVESASGKALTVEDGELIASWETIENRACHWLCLVENGWFIFKNHATGSLLSHDWFSLAFQDSENPEKRNRFQIIGGIDGDYKLLVLVGHKLLQVGLDEKYNLQMSGSEESEWKFVKV